MSDLIPPLVSLAAYGAVLGYWAWRFHRTHREQTAAIDRRIAESDRRWAEVEARWRQEAVSEAMRLDLAADEPRTSAEARV
jgi:hypothetical protein